MNVSPSLSGISPGLFSISCMCLLKKDKPIQTLNNGRDYLSSLYLNLSAFNPTLFKWRCLFSEIRAIFQFRMIALNCYLYKP